MPPMSTFVKWCGLLLAGAALVLAGIFMSAGIVTGAGRMLILAGAGLTLAAAAMVAGYTGSHR